MYACFEFYFTRISNDHTFWMEILDTFPYNVQQLFIGNFIIKHCTVVYNMEMSIITSTLVSNNIRTAF